MAVTLTVGTNTYATLDEATAFLDEKLGDEWSSATETQKKQALISAFRKIEKFIYDGSPASSTQTSKWPRSGLYNESGAAIVSNAIPEFVKQAQCEEAFNLLGLAGVGASSTRQKAIRDGVIEIKVGNADEKYSPEIVKNQINKKDALCRPAYELLSAYLKRSASMW